MGLAPGGRMHQEIYQDHHALEDWDQRHRARCFVQIANAPQWRAITGEAPPTRPPTAADYTRAGLPWFDYYAADVETLGGAQALASVKSVAEMAEAKGEQVLDPDGEVDPDTIVHLGPGKSAYSKGRPVREGNL